MKLILEENPIAKARHRLGRGQVYDQLSRYARRRATRREFRRFRPNRRSGRFGGFRTPRGDGFGVPSTPREAARAG